MGRSFIGALWGDYSKDSFTYCRESVDIEIEDVLLNNKNKIPIVTYIMGDDNYKFFTEKYPSYDAVKICHETSLYDSGRIWHNKLEILKRAMQDFDEIVYLDWDTSLKEPLPDDFWEKLRQKSIFQSPLYRYARPKLNWRKQRGANKFVPCGAFVYMRDKSIPQQLLDINKRMKLPNAYLDEVFYAKWVDEYWGEWKGIEAYRKEFEPAWCNIRKSVFIKDDACFYHPSTCKQRRKRASKA